MINIAKHLRIHFTNNRTHQVWLIFGIFQPYSCIYNMRLTVFILCFSHSLMLLSYVCGFFLLPIFLEAKSGLSEAELEDILSCDDDVLNDVYMYWTPPIRRLPPLLLVRLKASLEDKHYLGMTEFSY